MGVDNGDLVTDPRTTAEIVAETAALRAALAAAEERARLAEEQLLRVHRAVRAVKKESHKARRLRLRILDGARAHAKELVRQAEREARAKRAKPGVTSFSDWEDTDPNLDAKLESYLEFDLEPDASRDWILGERSSA